MSDYRFKCPSPICGVSITVEIPDDAATVTPSFRGRWRLRAEVRRLKRIERAAKRVVATDGDTVDAPVWAELERALSRTPPPTKRKTKRSKP